MDERPVSTEITELAFQIIERLRQRLNANAATLDLPPVQAMALANLRTPAPMRDLADFMACDASNVTGIVDGLERKGLVKRQPDPADRRVKHLVLTEEGERRRAALRAYGDKAAAEIFDLPEDDQQVLRDLLARIVTNFR